MATLCGMCITTGWTGLTVSFLWSLVTLIHQIIVSISQSFLFHYQIQSLRWITKTLCAAVVQKVAWFLSLFIQVLAILLITHRIFVRNNTNENEFFSIHWHRRRLNLDEYENDSMKTHSDNLLFHYFITWNFCNLISGCDHRRCDHR